MTTELVLLRGGDNATACTSSTSFDEMDSATAALILRLQLEDSVEFLCSVDRKGKGHAGEVTDAQLAFAIYKADLERSATIFTDRAMTRSIAHACQADGGVLSSAFAQEQAEARDRRLALELGGVAAPLALAQDAVAEEEELDEELLEKLGALYLCGADEDSAASEGDSMALVPYGSTPVGPGKSSPGNGVSRSHGTNTSQLQNLRPGRPQGESRAPDGSAPRAETALSSASWAGFRAGTSTAAHASKTSSAAP